MSKIERKIENNKSYVNQNEFYYELIYQIEFKILDDKINVLAKILSEVKRSTTSSNFISLNEEQQIIDNDSLLQYFETHYYNSAYLQSNPNFTLDNIVISELPEDISFL